MVIGVICGLFRGRASGILPGPMMTHSMDVAQTRVERVAAGPSMEQILTILGNEPRYSLLESSASGRFTILVRDPVKTVEVPWGCGDPWGHLKACVGGVSTIGSLPHDLPFVGGWVGFFGYELGTVPERIPARVPGAEALPLGRVGLHDSAAVFDHLRGAWYATAVEWPAGADFDGPSAVERLHEVRAFLQRASHCAVAEPEEPTTSAPVPDLPREAYLDRARKVLRYIEAGDVYQVNLARRLTARTSASDVTLYRRLREFSPSSHAALLRFGDGSVICSSPELFLDLRGRRVVTRPIKGTRPRADEAWKDASLRRELEESEKDQAELTMIVDLLRNDLGRVCEYGSVRVSEPRTIEEHPTLFHQVATIEGTLRSGEDWRTLLAATFPGGSITGAPKIRAMQIIRELEPTPRGVYCGSIGWIGLNGDASFNIAIRTMVQRGEQIELHAGGGIVADSSAEAEYEETEVKLRGILAALGRSERVVSSEVSSS